MIWLASFPRSGNTFCRNIFDKVFGISSSAINQRHIGTYSPLTEYPVVKTHLLPRDLPCHPQPSLTIYLVRDGRDALVSTAHHKSSIVDPGSDYQENLREVFIAKKNSHFGGWQTHVLSWLAKADLVIRFEDLIQDPKREFSRINRLHNLPDPNWDELPTFKSQKAGQIKYGKNRNKSTLFFRRGKMNDWKTEMPREMQNRFWEKCQHTMELLGYSHDGELGNLPSKQQLGHLLPSIKSDSQKTSLLNKIQSVIIGNSNITRQKIKMSAEVVFFQAVIDPYQRIESLIRQQIGLHSIAVLSLDDRLQLRIRTLEGKGVSDYAQIRVCIVQFAKLGLDSLVSFSEKPKYLTWIRHPSWTTIYAYSNKNKIPLEQLVDMIDKDQNNSISKKLRQFARKHLRDQGMQQVLSIHSGEYLDLIGDFAQFSTDVKAMFDLCGWNWSASTLSNSPDIETAFPSIKSSFGNRQELELFSQLKSNNEIYG